METILVTGSTGFVGNYVIRALLKKGIRVIASSGNAQKAKQQEWFSDVSYIPLNLGSLEPSIDYYSFFGKPDNVIHLAWEGLPDYKKDFHVNVNLPRHQLFLENLVGNGLRDLTVTGTCLEYGMQEGVLREDMPKLPTVAYAVAKNSLRIKLQQLQASTPIALKWVRLFYMYGEGQNPNSLLSQLNKALGEGKTAFDMSGGAQVRDYLPVEKVADHLVRIALQNEVTGEINCCSGIPVTVKQFVENYLVSNNRHISLNLGHYPYPDYEPMAFWGDSNKLKTIP